MGWRGWRSRGSLRGRHWGVPPGNCRRTRWFLGRAGYSGVWRLYPLRRGRGVPGRGRSRRGGIGPQRKADAGRSNPLIGHQQLDRQADLLPEAEDPQGPLGGQQSAISPVDTHLQQRRAIHPQHQSVICGQPDRKQAGATGWDIRRQQLGDLGGDLNGLYAHVLEGLISRRIPKLAERLGRHVLTVPPGQKALGTA